MKTIVAGRIVASEEEHVEAAHGIGADLADLRQAPYEMRADFVTFLEDTSDPANDLDRQNIAYFRRVLGVRPSAVVVPMPRPGTAGLATGAEVRAA